MERVEVDGTDVRYEVSGPGDGERVVFVTRARSSSGTCR